MFGLSRALQVWVHTEPTDMRKSFNTLSALVTEEMHREVLSGDLFVFISRDRKRAKVLHFDGQGSSCGPSASSAVGSRRCTAR